MQPEKKLLLDPAISMVLFNEYIPLRRPGAVKDASAETSKECVELSKRLDGLFLGTNGADAQEKKEPGGLFLRSEGLPAPVPASNDAGLFIRSGDVAPKLNKTIEEDWVIA